jgi:hypothetical protein
MPHTFLISAIETDLDVTPYHAMRHRESGGISLLILKLGAR